MPVKISPPAVLQPPARTRRERGDRGPWFALTIGVGALLGAGCQQSSTSDHASPRIAPTSSATAAAGHVETVVVTSRVVPRYLSVTGQLKSGRETDLAAGAGGRVTATLVERGSRVKAGEVLAKLDIRAAALSALEARAQAEGASVASENARKDCDRARALLASGAISHAEFDRTTGLCRTSVSTVAAAQARSHLAAQSVNDGLIRAPFDATVTDRYVDVGEFVRPDSRVVTLVDLSDMRAELTIPEANIAAAHPGKRLTFSVAGYPDRTFTGAVTFVAASVRPTTRDIVVEATVDPTEAFLRPGMFVSGRIASGEETTAVLPRTAIVTREGRSSAFVNVGGRIEQRLVQIGEPFGDEVAISRGIAEGENVVIAPGDDLRNGSHVAVD